ncbi:MAG: hypothetical protein QOE70_3030 [Chthoniobacter sp.]|jgi:hypothetical protein|nr:hypothetical protein [Chthoniobacter sp.]
MNWIKENKFLFGFLIMVGIGAGVLGFLVFSAMGRYDGERSTYEEKVAELNRYQRLPVFPNQKNLDKLLDQKKQVNEEVAKLASSLAGQQIPIEDMTPERFQDKLRASVTAVKTKAGQNRPPTRLTQAGFFLGFEKYETAPPDKQAATALGRELKVIEWLTTTLIEKNVIEIKALVREELPEEKGRVKVEEAKPGAAKGGKSDKDKAVRVAVQKHPIELTFICDQGSFREILNAIVQYKGQFIIPRLVTVKNEKEKGPPRIAAAAPAPAGADPLAPAPADAAAAAVVAAAAAAASVPVGSAYIVGEERIEVTLALEMVEFSEVPAK